MAFDNAAVTALVSAVESVALATGEFRTVNFHEPKSAPGTGKRMSMWIQSIEPIAIASGLAATSGYVVISARVYGNMLQKPEDEIDPGLASSMCVLMAAYTADFTLGGTIKNIDLLGMYGEKLSMVAGYLTIDAHVYRIMTMTIPCVINDMFDQEDGE